MSRFRFDAFTLDVERRELRRGRETRALQPQVFDLLAYLVAHRERVVTKEELLEQLWPDTVVTDASLQRAVSQARQALSDAESPLIETHARRGYRFAGRVIPDRTADRVPRAVVGASPAWPAPRYVETNDGIHLAYRTLGGGPVDLVVVPGWSFPMDGWRGHPTSAALIDRLAKLGRVVLFDRRGVGLSDRVKALASLETRAADLRAVVEAVGSESAVLLGFSEGAPLALLHATQHAEHVRGLVLVGAFTRMAGHGAGWSPERVAELRSYVRAAWGNGSTVRAMFPRHADDPVVLAWSAEVERTGASPGAALDLLEMNLAVDARSLLPDVRASAVVLHHREDQVIDVENGRELARGLRDVRYVEASGSDHVFVFDDNDLLLDAVSYFVATTRI